VSESKLIKSILPVLLKRIDETLGEGGMAVEAMTSITARADPPVYSTTLSPPKSNLKTAQIAEGKVAVKDFVKVEDEAVNKKVLVESTDTESINSLPDAIAREHGAAAVIAYVCVVTVTLTLLEGGWLIEKLRLLLTVTALRIVLSKLFSKLI